MFHSVFAIVTTAIKMEVTFPPKKYSHIFSQQKQWQC